MCTAISFKKNYHGRNLDLEFDLPLTKIVITPKNYSLNFRVSKEVINIDYAIIGVAMVSNDYPLYYDAMNEKGLFVSSLNFDGYAKFFDVDNKKNNIAPFELILYILGSCKNVEEARKKLENVNIVNLAFSDKFMIAPLHWIISDENESIVVESVSEGLKVYDNPVGVLTNNPDFSFHLANLNNFAFLSPSNISTSFDKNNKFLKFISNGVGTSGLPGGLSSTDRFIRASYTKLTSISADDEISIVTQFFHILDSVAQIKGQVEGHENRHEITIYSNCYSSKTQTIYFKTYDNNQINAISLVDFNTNENKKLLIFDFYKKQNINYIKDVESK